MPIIFLLFLMGGGRMRYKLMRLFILFDLPTDTPVARKEYTQFRKSLLANGFFMLQYSVYVRFCTSREQAAMFLKRIEKAVPENGLIRGLFVTEKQFADMPILLGNMKVEECEPGWGADGVLVRFLSGVRVIIRVYTVCCY